MTSSKKFFVSCCGVIALLVGCVLVMGQTMTINASRPWVSDNFLKLNTSNDPIKGDVAQVSRLTPANVEINDVFTVVINSTTFNFTATAGTVANVTAGLTTAINADGPLPVTAVDATTWVTLTADATGISFTLKPSATNGGATDSQTLTASLQTFPGGLSASSPLSLPDGDLQQPSLFFSNETNSGIFRYPGDNGRIRIVSKGIECAILLSTDFQTPASVAVSHLGAMSVNGNTTLGDAVGDSVICNAGTLTFPNGATVGTAGKVVTGLGTWNIPPYTTKGDIAYHDGTNVARLAVGASGTALVGGATPSWGYQVPNVATVDRGYFLFPIGWYPTVGGTGLATLADIANRTRCIQVVLPFRLTVSKIIFFLDTAGAAGTKAGLGIYDAAGTTLKLETGAVLVDAGAGATKKVTLGSAVTLEPGVYWFAWTSDSTTAQIRGVGASSAIVSLFDDTVDQLGNAANNGTAGVLPATLGTVTTVSMDIPFANMKP